MKVRLYFIVLVSSFVVFLSSCAVLDDFIKTKNQESVENQNTEHEKFNAIIKKDTYPTIQTPQGANMLDLETPLRCFVNWDTQEMISNIPYNLTAFNLMRNGINDHLPRFEVNGFSFDTMPAEKALLKLTKEAGIKLVAKDAPYASISAENLRGDLTDVINMIADAAEIYYTYNATNKTLRISVRIRKAK